MQSSGRIGFLVYFSEEKTQQQAFSLNFLYFIKKALTWQRGGV
jgi:hypothetical protein